MIKDVMVRLDGTAADELRLAFLALSVIASQTVAANLELRPLGKVIEESLLIFAWVAIGGRSKSFSTSGGRPASAISIGEGRMRK